MNFRRPFLAFSLVLLLVPSFVWAQQPALKTIPATALARPDARDRQIVSTVPQLIEEAHLTRHKLDNEISGRLHRLFLEHWDPRKLFFLESDIEEFAGFENKHVKQIMASDLTFPVRVY